MNTSEFARVAESSEGNRIVRREGRKPHAVTSGMLLAGASVPISMLQGAAGSLFDAPRWQVLITALSVALLITAGVAIAVKPKLGQAAATVGILGAFLPTLSYLAQSPLATFLVLISGTAGLALLWQVGAPLIRISRDSYRLLYKGQARGAALVTMALWLFWTFTDFERQPADILAVCWAMGQSVILGLEWAVRVRKRQPGQSALFFAGLMAAGLGCFLLWGRWWWIMHGLAGVVALSVLLIRPSYRLETNQSSWWEPLLGHPERLFVGTFAGLVLVGTVLLALPQSFTSGHSIGLLDAAFTSTSAVCVTGLGVLGTSDFSGFGQVAILLMIQVGGLGIMTFSTTALWALGKRVSMRYEGAAASLISTQDRGRLFSTAKMILGFTLVTEITGAVFLTVLFYEHGDSLRAALWRGVFTSISAFCNAGFALQRDSLVAYQHAPSILHIVGLLIVLGGLSPMAVFALPALLRIRKSPVSAQAKLSLLATGILLVLGFFFILAFEWHNALDDLTIAERLQNAWFQSITLRTAGFNSIDMVALQPPTLTLMMLWMFIGGSPGGTAGGLKTTTVSLLVLSVVRAVQGRRTIEAFKKSIPERTRAKAAVIVVVAAVTAVTALVAMQLTQQMPTRLAAFEVISALGTVGLSIGGTAMLDGIGKVVHSVNELLDARMQHND